MDGDSKIWSVDKRGSWPKPAHMRNPGLPNITANLTTVSMELEGEEEYLKSILEGMQKFRDMHIQQESDGKIRYY